jgi:hypothetical protein
MRRPAGTYLPRPVRHQADQPPGRFQPGRRLHQRRGKPVQPPAPGRDRPLSSPVRPLSRPLCAGDRVPGRSPSSLQWRAVRHRRRVGRQEPPIGGFLRLLAARQSGMIRAIVGSTPYTPRHRPVQRQVVAGDT